MRWASIEAALDRAVTPVGFMGWFGEYTFVRWEID